MPAVVTIGASLLTGTAISTATYVTAAIQVGAVVASTVYQKRQAKKMKAAQRSAQKAAARQAAQMANAAASLSRKAKAENFSFSDFGTSRSISETIKRSVVSHRIPYGRSRLGGIFTYYETTGASREYLHMVFVLGDGPIDGVEKLYFNEEEVTFDPVTGQATNKFAGYARVKVYDGTQTSADPDLVAESAGGWTSAHILKGCAYIYVRLYFNAELFGRTPEVSAIVRGRRDILDPRTGQRRYTANSALIAADYLTTQTRGPGIPWDRIDLEALKYAADVCDERIELIEGGTEARYETHGAVDLSLKPEDLIGLLLAPMAGQLIRANGTYEIQAATWQTPTFEIGVNELSGGLTIQNRPQRRELANVVKGTFVGESNQWQRSDFPAQRDDELIVSDGREYQKDLELEFVASPSQAQRLARIMLKSTRLARSFSLRCNLAAMPAKAGSNIIIRIPRHAPEGVMCEVQEVSFSVGGSGEIMLNIQARETGAEVFEWRKEFQRQHTPAPVVANGVPVVAQPIFSPPPGNYGTSQSVSIASLTSGASIRYSLSAVPASDTDGSAYSSAVTVAPGQTLYARAFKSGHSPSSPTLGAYL